MQGPKVTVIGAGSHFFGRPVIHKFATSDVLAGGTLALVDTNEKVLKTMVRLARRVLAHTGCGAKVIGSTDRRDVMAHSDFVVLTFSDRNASFRGIDTMLAARHGIRMCSSDTVGPGGIFRALREVPVALAVARDVRRLCPHAWVINFVNPTTVLGIALRRYAPEVKSFALCDGHHEPYCTLNWCKHVGILPEDADQVPPDVADKLDLRIAGVNHFTWVLRFEYAAKDMMPRFRRVLAKRFKAESESPGEYSKGRYNAAYSMQLWRLFGCYPDCIGHTKEYVPFFQGYGVRPARPEPIALFDAEARTRQMADRWAETRRYAAGTLTPRHFLRNVGNDHATDIIESMWGGLGKPFFINTFNRGAVTNMADDAFLELRCDLDMHGPRPQPVGEMPRGILGMQRLVLDTHELTAEAAAACDRAILRRAMLTDPICNNIPDADACMRDLLEAERDALPDAWFKKRRKS